MAEITNHNIETIRKDIEHEFKKIESSKTLFYRDDQEIIEAAVNIVDKYFKQRQKEGHNTGSWMKTHLKALTATLRKQYNDIANKDELWHITDSDENREQINRIAHQIDAAENKAIQRLKLNNTNRDSRNLVEKSKHISVKKTPMFIMEGGSNYKKQTGALIFTKSANPVKIHTALKGLFNNPNQVYQIDFSKCTNKNIKMKMARLSGVNTCYLRYDLKQKTYTIRDKNGNGITDRALIWEGVRLIPDGVRKWLSYNKQQTEQTKRENSLKNIDKSKQNQSKLVQQLLRDMPSAKQYLTLPNFRETLVLATEQKLTDLLIKAKQEGYELHNEPITKKNGGSGLMELHLINDFTETDRVIDWREGELNPGIYNYLNNHKSEYKTYLTKRVHEIWTKLNPLTKTETVKVGVDKNQKTVEGKFTKDNLLYGIGLLEKMVNNFRESEGDSWLDNDDKRLVKMQQILRNAKASIEEADTLSMNNITKNILTPFRTERSAFKNIPKNKTSRGEDYHNPNYTQQYQHLRNVFFGKKSGQLNSTRSLGGYGRLLDKTETSYLADEIANNTDSIDIKTNSKDINICMANIKKSLFAKIDKQGKVINAAFLDQLYTAAISRDNLKAWLVKQHFIPSGWLNASDKDIDEAIDKLCLTINERKKLVDNPPETLESLATKQHQEKLKLEQKSSKTEADLQRIQALEYLEAHPDEQRKINQATLKKIKEELKYQGLQQLTMAGLLRSFVDQGNGASGTNADLYNDIMGHGTWNLSDENAKIAGEIIVEIAITVAIAVVTGGVGGAVVAGMLRGAAAGARAARWVNVANSIRKIVTAGQKGIKAASGGERWIKAGVSTTKLLGEGTVFNAASNMVHAAWKGTSLDSLNLNPLAKENIQTAAFLGALSIGNQLSQVIWKVGGSTKIGINLRKGLEAAKIAKPAARGGEVATELGTMLAAEQVINLTFGHDVIDPETGEVHTERSIVAPTQESLIQTIGMILAFKAVKPQLWHSVEQKMNKGSLEICRSTRANELLVRDKITKKVTPLKEYIDKQYNNYKPTPEQYKLRNHNKWREKQSKYELEILSAQELIEKNPELLNSQTIKKFKEAGDIVNLSPNDIKRIQREIGLKGKDVDGIRGPKSLEALSKYTDSNKVKSKNSIKESELFDQFSKDIFSNQGVNIGGDIYRYIFEQNKTHNQSRKGRIKLTKNGETLRTVEAESNRLPDNANGNGFREYFNQLREQYINEYEDKINQSTSENTINSKQKELNDQINLLKQEVAQLEIVNTSLSHNEYFSQHKQKLLGRKVWIDGIKYEASYQTKDGSIHFKQVDGNQNFTISSFNQLKEKGQVNGFSDTGNGTLKDFEKVNHNLLNQLFSGENQHINQNKASVELLNKKKLEITKLGKELSNLKAKNITSKQDKNSEVDQRPSDVELDLVFQKIEAGETQWDKINLNRVTKSQVEAAIFLRSVQKFVNRQITKLSNVNFPDIDLSFVRKLEIKIGEINNKFKNSMNQKRKDGIEYLNKKLDEISTKIEEHKEFKRVQEQQRRAQYENNIFLGKDGRETTNKKQTELNRENPKNIGYHGTNVNLGSNNKLSASKGTSEAFDGVSIAKDYEIALGYGLRTKISQVSGLKFRKGFTLNFNPKTRSFDIEIMDQNLSLQKLRELVQNEEIFIYKVAKESKNRKEAVNGNFGSFEMANNKNATNWLGKQTIKMSDLINQGKLHLPEIKQQVDIETNYLGQIVNIPRSNGSISKAEVISFNQNKGIYLVIWSENGQQLKKRVSKKEIDELNSIKTTESHNNH